MRSCTFLLLPLDGFPLFYFIFLCYAYVSIFVMDTALQKKTVKNYQKKYWLNSKKNKVVEKY